MVLGSVYPRYSEDSEVPWLRASLRELKRGGCRVAVVAPSHRGIKSHVIDGVPVHRFRYAPASLEFLTHDEGAPSKIARNPFLQLLAIPYIISGSIKTLCLCFKLKPGILHVHWPFPHAFMAYFTKIFRRKTPIVLNFHGAELLLAKKKKWIRPILKMFIKRADLIITNSSFTAKKVAEIYNREVEILPYGTTLNTRDGALSQRPDRAGGKFRVLFVGRHIERKGIEYLIRAAAMLDPEKFEIRIVGHGDLTQKLKEQASKEAPDLVIFLGKLSKEELEKEYETAGCFILPAIVDSKGDTEGLGVVLIEAAEYGLPIIASGVGGIVDVIKDNETGLLVNEKSPEELAEAIQRLYNDDKLCLALVENCKRRVHDYFSWDKIIAKQIGLYEELTVS
jgi:glycosyltransferase involved in cell wall biosynthesis